MKTLQLTFLAMLAVCFASCSGNNKAQDLADQILAKVKEVPAIVSNVSDLASAKAANVKLDALADELVVLDKEIKEIKVTQEKKDALDSSMEKEATEIFTKVGEKIAKLQESSPEAAAELQTGLAKFFEKVAAGN